MGIEPTTMCNTNYLHILMLFNIFFHPRPGSRVKNIPPVGKRAASWCRISTLRAATNEGG
jgi:hypothetical protein